MSDPKNNKCFIPSLDTASMLPDNSLLAGTISLKEGLQHSNQSPSSNSPHGEENFFTSGNQNPQNNVFLDALDDWLNTLPELRLAEIALDPARVAILSSDMINGFCKFGPLASPRIEALIQPVVGLFHAAWTLGVRHIILSQDAHEPAAVEFAAFSPHCVRGTPEAETVSEFRALPFFDQMIVLEKNTVAAHLDTGLNDWIDRHPEVDIYILVGDCTDICVYQAAMHLRLQANANNLQRRVIVPQNCVDTYDMLVETAGKLGILPHDGDLLHRVFLYHMALNGIEVIRRFIY